MFNLKNLARKGLTWLSNADGFMAQSKNVPQL